MIGLSKSRTLRDRINNRQKWAKPLFVGFLSLVAFFLVTQIFLAPIKLGSASMNPSLVKGSCVIASPIAFSRTLRGLRILPEMRGPRRGDIVVVIPPYYIRDNRFLNFINPLVRFVTFQRLSFSSYPRQSWENPLIVKRVIGIPGDIVKVDQFIAYVKSYDSDYYLSEFEMTRHKYDIRFDELPAGWDDQFPVSGTNPEIILGDNEYFVLGDNRTGSSDSRYWGIVERSEIVAKVIFQYWPLSEIGKP